MTTTTTSSRSPYAGRRRRRIFFPTANHSSKALNARCLILSLMFVSLLLSVFVVLRGMLHIHHDPQEPFHDNVMLKGPPPIQQQQRKAKATIGYAISLIKCSDFQSSTAGLIDAALVMRHSIHNISIRSLSSGSHYDYKMYALVHRQAAECAQATFEQVGFEVLVVDPPIQPSEIRGEFLKKRIHREWCCGHDEFIKLYAYTHIHQPIVVHVDIDFVFLQPMDELYDAMLYDKDSPEGRAARQSIAVETNAIVPKTMPDRIDAFFTKDWPQVIPGRKAAFQAGFIVLRPDPTVYTEVVEVIREGNFTEGFGRDNGWGGLGYGAFVGAMAMQGLMAYYYDVVRPNVAVELNQCRYNWMGMDTRYRAQPNFQRRFQKTGRCRNDQEECEDCRFTDLSLIKNIHFTQCRKPWNCVGEGYGGNDKEQSRKGYIDTKAGDLQQCLKVVRKWHEIRTDFEDKFYGLTNDPKIVASRSGDYLPHIFMGHCNEVFQKGYNRIDANAESFQQLAKLYA